MESLFSKTGSMFRMRFHFKEFKVRFMERSHYMLHNFSSNLINREWASFYARNSALCFALRNWIHSYIISLIIPCDNCLWMCSTVITGKYLSHIFIGVFLGENSTVDCGRVTASFCVHKELGIGNVPWYWTQWLRRKFLVWKSGVIDFDLMTTKRSARTT